MFRTCARLLVVVWSLSVVGSACAWADPSAPDVAPHRVDPSSADGAAVVTPATAALTAKLGKPATLKVNALNISGQWAFVYAMIQGVDGQPIDYQGTPFAEAAANGGQSRRYAGLLKQSGGQWSVIDQKIGPTSMAWQDWPQQYGVPAALVATS